MDHGVIAAALVPHPPIVVPEVGGTEAERVSATRRAMQNLAEELCSLVPDCVLLVDPHGPVGEGEVPLVRGRRARGDLGQFRAPTAAVDLDMDAELTERLAEAAKETDLCVRFHDPGTADFLGHGAVVPLYLLGQAGFRAPLIYAGLPLLSREELVGFGRLVAQVALEAETRLAVLASGDLSHRLSRGAPSGYHPDGQKFDRAVVEALRNGDGEALRRLPETLVRDAGQCGYNPLLVAIGALTGRTFSGTVLSYEGPFGVGYAVAHMSPGDEDGADGDPVKVARDAVHHYLTHGTIMPAPDHPPPGLRRRTGAFVTLRRQGQLRGCIGTVRPTRPNLAEEIMHNAVKAATRDPRFPAVTARELPEMEISVDVLSEPEPVEDRVDLDPGRFGIIVSRGRKRGLLLPDLEGIETAEQQLEVACRKAGLSPDDPALVIERFRVTRHTETQGGCEDAGP